MTRRTGSDAFQNAAGSMQRLNARNASSLLLLQFREFYRELLRLKKMVEHTTPVGALEPMAAAAAGSAGGGRSVTSSVATLSPEPAPSAAPVSPVWQQLLAILERQALEAGQTGGAFGFELYREAQYVMAALADEIFLNSPWAGRNSWPLLETRLFQTHYAGDAVFQKIDRILQRQDPFYMDLATVYFYALSLGFQGKYRGIDDRSPLEAYRRQLFVMIFRRNPRLFSSEAPLFAEAYEHTMEKVVPRRLPDERSWLWMMFAVVVLWVGLSHWAWTSISSDIGCLICQAMSTNCNCETGPAK